MSIELDDITSGYNLSKINKNFETVESYINDKLLARADTGVAGEGKMERDLDMDGFRILNADVDASTLTNDRAVRVADLESIPAIPQTDIERRGRIVSFDINTGNPIAVAPASGSAVDVLNQLALPTGAGLVGTTGGITVQQSLNALDGKILKNIVVSSVSAIQGIVGTSSEDTIQTIGFHSGSVVGGGTFRWSSSTDKTKHNGGTIIDPAKSFPSTWDASGKTSWYTASGTGTGCWLLVDVDGVFRAEQFGAIPWIVGGTQDSTLEFQQTATVAGYGGIWRWEGRHRITSFVTIPNKQTFGSFSHNTSVYSEIFNPTNFQGVHVGVDPSLLNTVTSAVFFDADSGEAFRCGEGSVPSNFLLYGKGYTSAANGANISAALPLEAAYLPTTGIRHGKYIKPENLTIVLFKYPISSDPWIPASRGDYYTTWTNCNIMYCFCVWRIALSAGEPTYNTKHINTRAYVNKLNENNYPAKNVVFVGGSIEGFNTPTVVRESAAYSFEGTYFETSDTNNTVMFNIVGWCALNFENCLIYMNNVTRWATTGGTTQTAGVTGIAITGHGNVWRRADAASGIIYEVDGVVRKSIGIYGDILHLGTGSTLGYYAGSPPAGIYAAPITLTA